MRFFQIATCLALLGICFLSLDAEAKKKKDPRSTVKDPEQILIEVQREVIDLDRQFETIRQDLFFPKQSEVLVYLRNYIPEKFPMKNVVILLNGKKLYQHQYTETEVIAFNFSSLQPLYRFNLSPGNYRMMFQFELTQGGTKTRSHQFSFEKQGIPRFIEVQLAWDRKAKAVSISNKIW